MGLVYGLLVSLCVVLSVAFFTLVERKSLAAFQIRKGPQKTGILGLPQPIADALKLVMKDWWFPWRSNVYAFIIGPFFSFFVALIMWFLLPVASSGFIVKLGIIWFMCLSSLSVYGVMSAGWSSNSKYAMLGTMRAVAQVISYEISMGLILFFPVVLGGGFYSINKISSSQCWLVLGLVFFQLTQSWLITVLAETQRPPFDLAEGESELVSGYHVEYSGVGFAAIFLAEYTSLLLMGAVSVAMFLGGVGDFLFICLAGVLAWLSVWVRASFPRYRYDQLMGLTWKVLCPLSLGMLSVCCGVFCLV
uniref:NADH dehydrogenase subunit 1 n=1 Tax=Barbatia decussata TaxID=1508519 RepID=UPI002028D378|nr:NADH dehydrogenase subunit 1 [Barbatia decussata]UQT66004.1 NADH dehydrogenase subunit 1 [Barbatia decussata]